MFGHFFNIEHEQLGTYKIAPWKIDPRKIASYSDSSGGQFSGHEKGQW